MVRENKLEMSVKHNPAIAKQLRNRWQNHARSIRWRSTWIHINEDYKNINNYTNFLLCLAKCTRSRRIPWSSRPGRPSRWAYPRRSCRAACSCARFGRRHRPRPERRDRVSIGYERDACAAFDACYWRTIPSSTPHSQLPKTNNLAGWCLEH